MFDSGTLFTAFAYLFPLAVLFGIVLSIDPPNSIQVILIGLLVYVIVVGGGTLIVRYRY